MPLSRQSLSSVAEVLGALSSDSAGLLLYKHLGIHLVNVEPGALGRLRALEAADPDDVWNLVSELARESAAIRASAPTKYVFDGCWREVQRWLLHDGWKVESGELARLAPGAEEATGIRDALIDTLASSSFDGDEDIRASIRKAANAFIQEPPDYNASITHVRIALETTARRAATARARAGGAPYPSDSWGSALAYLRTEGILESSEEEILARVYTFISPGAHVPKGITQEEWARLARTFGLGACFFILKRHNVR
jgi:hypothetical protein